MCHLHLLGVFDKAVFTGHGAPEKPGMQALPPALEGGKVSVVLHVPLAQPNPVPLPEAGLGAQLPGSPHHCAPLRAPATPRPWAIAGRLWSLNPQAESSPPSVFVNKVLLEHGCLVPKCRAYAAFCRAGELQQKPCGPKALRKRLLTPGL